jgi:hypothetical protein
MNGDAKQNSTGEFVRNSSTPANAAEIARALPGIARTPLIF